MKSKKKIAKIFLIVSVILIFIMFFHVGFSYIEHIKHPEWSAPASVELLLAIPYLIAISLSLTLSHIMRKQEDQMQ